MNNAATKFESFNMSIGELLSMYVDGSLSLIGEDSPYTIQMTDILADRIINDLKSGSPLPFAIIADLKKDGNWNVSSGAEVLRVIFDYMQTDEWDSLSVNQRIQFKRNIFRLNIVYSKSQV